MFKKMFYLVLIALLMFIPIKQAIGALAAADTSWGTDDVYEVNNATPGTSKTFLGTRLQGPLVTGITTETVSSVAADNVLTGETITTPVVSLTTSVTWGSSTTLNNGYQNQQVTWTLVTDGGKDHKVSPSTATGFTSITLNDANDAVTLRYINSTVGWVIVGINGVTVN